MTVDGEQFDAKAINMELNYVRVLVSKEVAYIIPWTRIQYIKVIRDDI